jgi:hypothetical protein
MATSDEFLGHAATGGTYDLPNYGVIRRIADSVLPKPKRPRGGGEGTQRGTREMLDEGKAAATKEAEAEDAAQAQRTAQSLSDFESVQKPTEAPTGDEPAGPTPATPTDEAAPPSVAAGDQDPLGATLPDTQGPSVAEIEATKTRAGELAPRTWERNVNLDYIENADDIGAVLEANASKAPQGMDEVYTHEQLIKDVDGNEMEIFGKVLKENPQALSQQQLLAGRNLMTTLAKRQDELAELIAANKATPEDILEFDKVTDSAAMVLSYMQGKIRETARALNSMKVVSQSINSLDPARIANEAKNINAQQRAALILQMKREGVAVDQRVEIGGQMSPLKRATTSLMNLRAAGLVSGFKTNAVNLFSNTVWGGTRTLLVRPMAAAMGRLRTGGGEGADRVYLSETRAEIVGTLHALADGFNLAYDTWYNGTVSNQGEYISPFGGRKADEITHEVQHFGTAATDAVETFGIGGKAAAKALKLVRADKAMDGYHQDVEAISFGFLTAGDDFFKTMHYRKSLYGQANRQASKEGLSGKAHTERANELLNEITSEMHYKAMNEAEVQTFTNREDVIKALKMTSDFATKMGQHVPIFKWWAPFIRTPVSIFDRTIKMSPGAMLTDDYKARIKKGGPDADMARAEMAVGTLITTTMTALVGMGLITGNGPSRSDDPSGSRRRVLESSGWQRNSILIDDKYISLERGFEPFMLPSLGIAQMVDAAKYAGTETDAFDYMAGATVVAASQFIDNTFMRGMKELLDLVLGRVNYNEYIGKQAGSMVPSILRDVKNIMRYWSGEEGNPTVPKSDDLTLAVMYNLATRIPGMEVPMVTRYWDGTIANPGGGDMMFMWNTMMPIRSSYLYDSKGRQFDPAVEALNANQVSVSQPQPEITIDPNTGYSIHLLRDIPGGGEKLYGLLLETVGRHRRTMVEQFIDSSDYQEMLDQELLGPKSWANIYLGRALTKGLESGKKEFIERLRDPEFPWSDYGIMDTESVDILSGAQYMDVLGLFEDDALRDDQRKALQEGGFRGLPTREPIEPPRGSGEQYVPKM